MHLERNEFVCILVCIFAFGSFHFSFQNGETALHAAAMFGHLPVVKQLIAAGSDLSWKNHDGYTPLQVARQQNFTGVVEYLEERRALLKVRGSRSQC